MDNLNNYFKTSDITSTDIMRWARPLSLSSFYVHVPDYVGYVRTARRKDEIRIMFDTKPDVITIIYKSKCWLATEAAALDDAGIEYACWRVKSKHYFNGWRPLYRLDVARNSMTERFMEV